MPCFSRATTGYCTFLDAVCACLCGGIGVGRVVFGGIGVVTQHPLMACRIRYGDLRSNPPRTDPCHYCQTSVSPAWRSAYEGGPRVYCNACAMRFRSTGSFEYRNKSSGRKPSSSPTKSARRCVLWCCFVLYGECIVSSTHSQPLSSRQSMMMDEFAPSTPNRKSFEFNRAMIAMDSPPRHRVRTVRRGPQDDPEWIMPGALRVPPPPPLSAFGGFQDESMSPLGPVPPLFGWTGPSTPPSGLKRRAGSDLAESFMLDFYHPGVVRVKGGDVCVDGGFIRGFFLPPLERHHTLPNNHASPNHTVDKAAPVDPTCPLAPPLHEQRVGRHK